MPNLNRRPGRHQFPDFVHFTIGETDASVSPVGELCPGFYPVVSGRQTMDHDISAWIDAELAGAFAVCRIGIGDTQSEVAAAARVPAIDGVSAFGGFVVALLLFGTAGRAVAQRYVVDLEHFAIGIERHGVIGFVDDDAVGSDRMIWRLRMDGEREKRGGEGEWTQHVPVHGIDP